MAEAPEFLNDFQPGAKPVQGQGRAERLKAAGVPEAETLADYHRRLREEAWANAGSQEDPGAAYQKAESKVGRQNVMPLSPESMAEIQRIAKESGRPVHPESGLVLEPTTEKTVSGHSDEKKEAVRLMKKDGISLQDAIAQVRGESVPKKSRRKGK